MAGPAARAGRALALAPSHLSVSTRSLLSGSFRFLKKQSEGEFSAGTSVRAGPGEVYRRWAGGTQAQRPLAHHLAGQHGSSTVPLQQGAQHAGPAPPHTLKDGCREEPGEEEGVDVRAHAWHTQPTARARAQGGFCTSAP